MFNRSMHALNCFANDLVYYDYYQVFSTFCSTLTRLNRKIILSINTGNGDTLNSILTQVNQLADESFQTFTNYFDQYFKEDKSRTHYFEVQYIEFMLENLQYQRAIDFFENSILTNELFRKELRVWQEYVHLMDRINWYEMAVESPIEFKHQTLQQIFEDAINSIENQSAKQIFSKTW